MIQLAPQMRILVAVEPADFRKGIDGLAQLEGTINVSLLDGFTPAFGDTFSIMTADLGITIGANGLSLTGDGNFNWELADDGKTLNLTAVPEPSTIILLCMGVFGLLAYTRRRRG